MILRGIELIHVNWLNPVQDGHFWGCSQMGGKPSPLSKICRTYSTMKKLDTVIPYLKNI